MSGLTHIGADGRATMVDVSAKPETVREATAEAIVTVPAPVAAAIGSGSVAKGEVLRTAELAGVMAAKKTAELVPLCHPLPIDQVVVTAVLENAGVVIRATVRTAARTGVEMEAMTAASVAALTVYDMVKGMDKAIEIGGIRLVEKKGGKSGHWTRA